MKTIIIHRLAPPETLNLIKLTPGLPLLHLPMLVHREQIRPKLDLYGTSWRILSLNYLLRSLAYSISILLLYLVSVVLRAFFVRQ